jgi:hypothetical protein
MGTVAVMALPLATPGLAASIARELANRNLESAARTLA